MGITRGSIWAAVGLAVAMGIPCPATAAGDAPESPQGPSKAAAEPTVAPAPNVGLDQLLRLPDAYDQAGSQRRVGGASADEWRSRFQDADEELAEARRNLNESRRSMEEASTDSSEWQMAAPGGKANSDNSGLSVQGRQRIRRYREELEEAERRRRALEVEADLAGVPAEWRR